ncbi:MAG: hypothetical protein BKP49_03165 [Treponema sp. CETP13]|nr:MAG: hypothetical protein BKP49_03165 [Treponema sp. CETP13]
MKKLVFYSFILFELFQVSLGVVFAQSENTLVEAEYVIADATKPIVLIPSEVFVGDTAEIRYTFVSNKNLCKSKQTVFVNGNDFVDLAWTAGSVEANLVTNLCDIQSAMLVCPSGGFNDAEKKGTYEIVMKIIPWTPGPVDIPSFDIMNVFILPFSQVEDVSPLMIDLPAFTISSIIEKTQKKSLQSPVGPVVIPGTTWIIYALLVLGVVLLFLIILAIARFKSVSKFINLFMYRIFLNKNYRTALKTLTKLEKNISQIGIKNFASGVTDEIRRYLQNRFDVQFSSVETSKLYTTLNTKMAGLLSDNATNAIESLQTICLRLDYIKFSGLDEKEYTDDFSEIVKKIFEAFAYLEKQEDDNEL